MLIFPAIDILGGKVVRLYKGDYESVKNYSLEASEAAREFKAQGAGHLHAVDLDGAKSGNADNAQTVAKIIAATDAFVEIGGGVRSEQQIADYLEAGAGRVILGTAAVRDFAFTERMVKKYPQKIAVGVDALAGKVAVSGWREVTELDSIAFCERLADAGVDTVIYTDISRDGTLAGTNLKIYERLVQIKGLHITASGGITALDELDKLKEMGVYAAIVGKAIYEGRLSLQEAVRRAEC